MSFSLGDIFFLLKDIWVFNLPHVPTQSGGGGVHGGSLWPLDYIDCLHIGLRCTTLLLNVLSEYFRECLVNSASPACFFYQLLEDFSCGETIVLEEFGAVFGGKSSRETLEFLAIFLLHVTSPSEVVLDVLNLHIYDD